MFGLIQIVMFVKFSHSIVSQSKFKGNQMIIYAFVCIFQKIYYQLKKTNSIFRTDKLELITAVGKSVFESVRLQIDNRQLQQQIKVDGSVMQSSTAQQPHKHSKLPQKFSFRFNSDKIALAQPSHIKSLTPSTHLLPQSKLAQSRLSQLPNFTTSCSKRGQLKNQLIQLATGQYLGEWQHGQPNGLGRLALPSGDLLQATFQNGQACGLCRLIYKDGSVYQGEMVNGVADGYGRYENMRGYRYEGRWFNDAPNGEGKAVYPDGGRYVGEFLNWRRNGIGIYCEGNGTEYEGMFIEDMYEGEGTYRTAEGEVYKGNWVRNWQHGKGVYSWPNGDRYDGYYKNGKRHGHGTFYYRNGETYTGQWKNGMKDGKGTYKTSHQTLTGIWHQGNLIKPE